MTKRPEGSPHGAALASLSGITRAVAAAVAMTAPWESSSAASKETMSPSRCTTRPLPMSLQQAMRIAERHRATIDAGGWFARTATADPSAGSQALWSPSHRVQA
jgi:hypothetical protein